ncbi:acyl-CoA dehydrogenase family protein [Mycobacterium crocinum]|uniref:Acyl-CoA/acyl-ACP dehydrogenase n=2 Tax=Mycolicibacterium TaxID=1866885 RepID=A0ABX8VHW1_9MYCO|nr:MULTISPECIES: acyl-CoA dehydrogenase family protein [Mycolicibacterium]MCV7216563.1 acyl-CoA dehydrogenase family protein [Mycolicibacterium crocinum]QYL17272.1 acyl-CoA/acyl-ACP dehydrogenase [Mycolicibacterium pallens]ULN41928.1 acyl-CoA/acyl-ACP dehydrogenase [Mycolicibacterium crocinum]
MATLTTEQRDLAEAVTDLMAKRSPEAEVRRLMATDTGYDPGVWAELAAMGLLGLAIPEQFGGAGAGAVEVGLVMEAMGRALLCAPYLSTAVLTTGLLAALGDSAEQADVLPRIAAGELITTVAFAEAGSARPPLSPATTARADGSEWRLSGTKTYVLDSAVAERMYVLAGEGVFAVDAGAPGLDVSLLSTVDQTRKLGRVVFDDTPARLVGAEGAGAAAMDQALDRASVALLGEQAGGTMCATRMAADYAKTRFQFGRAIGSFQAIKHMCADMLLEAESAVSAARHVAAAFDADDAARFTDLAVAQAYCSEAFVTVAANNIQVHGGIGFTWEHPAHLYLRRARTDAQLFGEPAWHRERYLRLREAQR